ncbi:gag protease polyprotein [Cucumis melo var. makuwa]|uniref:Gag protease polyprotein n=1 Tax=Cucumis melo var. makuwa TaxID=1194695 RepID=A0A5A7V995_CUCMM|nr:gag protease polyprotein [Cucumis melo var. makuwa]
MCASFGSTRLTCASFGSTRLICAFYGTTRLLCRVRAQRGAERREAGRMREGHMDASGFLIASADGPILFSCNIFNVLRNRNCWYQSLSFRFCRLTYNVSLCFVSLWLKRSLPLVREMPPERGARRGGRGGRGRGAGRVQPEMQSVAQATDPVAPVTHADLAAMEQSCAQVVPDQLSAEAKHLRDFRKYNPTTFDGSLEDPTRA